MNLQHVNVGVGSGGVGVSTTALTVTFNLSTPGDALNVEIFNANSPATVQAINLSSGANTINTTTCPQLATAGAVIIVPPANNGQTLILKGVVGDTGVQLSPVCPTLLGCALSPQASFVLVAGGAITGLKLIFI